MERPQEERFAANGHRATGRPVRQGRDPDDKPVLGLGDHVPMFLLRPTRVKPAREEAEG